MSIESKLDQALISSPVIEIDDRFKGLFVSDLHMGVGNGADDFKSNAKLCLDTLWHYMSKGYRIFVLGDAYELWENSNLDEIVKNYPGLCDFLSHRVDRIRGNHDQKLILPESYILFNKKLGKKILLVHGHQGDFFCDEGYPLGWFFSKYIWRNLQMLGFKDPTTAQKDKNPQKHELTRIAFHDWAWSRKQTVIFGHTHLAESDLPYYWNCGSWVGNGGQAIVINGDQMMLKTFKQ
jgi:UDP-2,3-diacylglucosamine pyrophosphatase LpxH